MPLPIITREQATTGTTGQLRKDIEAMSDPARRLAATRDAAMEANVAQNLRALSSGEEMQSLNDRLADMIMRQTMTPKRLRKKQSEELVARIQEMDKEAELVQESGTGNMKAYNTYMQVANILRERLRKLQTESIEAPGGSI